MSANPHDIALLEHLPKENNLKDVAVVFIHLMGSHVNYADRYPYDFHKWNDDYDNSILYNDYVVQKIYEHFSVMKNFNAFFYFADHADDPEYKSHDASNFTWEMTKVPFYIYFSDDYISQYANKYKILKEHRNKPFTNDMVFDTLLGILDITDEQFYVPKNDLSSEHYHYTKADLSTLHGEKSLLDDDMVDRIPEKFWLRRVNSPDKMRQLGYKYKGLELDIIYYSKENNFENSHEPTNLKLYHLEKTLKMYNELSYTQALWFDFKNLTETNKINAEKKLFKLINKYHINKNDVWIESQNHNALEYFTKNGWKTSYYLPDYNFVTMPQEEFEKVQKLTEDISFSGKVSAISFAGQDYFFIKQFKLNKQISLLTWFDGYTFSELKRRNDYSQLLEDPQLKVILIKETGKYHR